MVVLYCRMFRELEHQSPEDYAEGHTLISVRHTEYNRCEHVIQDIYNS
jgi:hypothetical protein